ncbi:MAG TPA: S8 family serine peptidase [Roseiflexaceae bacterium]|nr:S8 family serine peptidase [Roseiflexaceae bacterium]
MRRPLSALTLACVACLLLIGLRPVPTHAEPERLLHLRRATFDPLQRPVAPSLYARNAVRSQLRLVQLEAPVGAETPAQLRAAGLEPLVYVPDNAFVVRAAEGARGPEALADLRWSGALDPIHKLAPALDTMLAAGGTLDLRLQTTPDRDGAELRAAVVAAGGQPLSGGALLRARVPAGAVPGLAGRDDLLWIEPDAPLRLHNSEARDILGVQEFREDSGLDGKGQIVAVTDTGLDIQSDVQNNANGDFPANRIARGYSRAEMDSSCSTLDAIYEPDNWSDRNGHGTHVAGTVLGTGLRSNGSQSGMAPGAQLVVQSVSTGGTSLNCLDFDTFLPLAYTAGARIQNMSFGGGDAGDYGSFSQLIDDFVWDHKDHLIVVSGGNDGEDCLPTTGSGGCGGDGVIDPTSVTPPATAKNVISVGASENNRPPSTPGCASTPQERRCWSFFSNLGLGRLPFGTDNVSDDPLGMAAFSSRGPTSDGRIKPEIVAPGTNIISARSHHSEAGYPALFGDDYAYDSGTSMAAPMVSGLAALVRQWLAQQGTTAPSAALVKALLLNGAADLAPGQYGEGATREIPAAWPNNVQGWGRASILGATGRADVAHRYWENTAGLQTGGSATYGLSLAAGQTVRATLVWTDPPGSALASKALVNDLDLELLGPGGQVVAKGNAAAPLPASCRDAQNLDRCNNVEGIALSAPAAGNYTLRVRGFLIPQGPQPFALAVGTPPSAKVVAPTSAPAPVEASVAAASPLVTVGWGRINGVRNYQVLVTTPEGQVIYTTAQISLTFVGTLGSSDIEVRACNIAGCGPYSAPVEVTITTAPSRAMLPLMRK